MPITLRNESIVFYVYASSLYAPQTIFLSNLHGDISDDVVVSPCLYKTVSTYFSHCIGIY